MNETLNVLETRRSLRAYDPRPVEREKLEAILAAGTYAPSAMGRQSVTMAVLTKKEDIAELSALNAAVMGASGDPFYGEPCVVVVLADPEATSAANAQRDGSLVMGNLMNAAWSLGVSSCWINRAEEVFAGPEGKALLRRWGLPEGLVGVGNCVLGYAAGGIPAAAPRKADFVKFVD